MTFKVEKSADGIQFCAKVIPKSSANSLFTTSTGEIKLKITAAPVDGKANEACIKVLSEILNISKSSIKLVSGHKSRQKVFKVEGNPNALSQALSQKLNPE